MLSPPNDAPRNVGSSYTARDALDHYEQSSYVTQHSSVIVSPDTSLSSQVSSTSVPLHTSQKHQSQKDVAVQHFYQGLPTVTVKEFLSQDEEASSAFASPTYFGQWYNFVRAFPLTVDLPNEYLSDRFVAVFVDLKILLTVQPLSIETLKEISVLHSLRVPSRPRKTFLQSLMCKHSCPSQDCCVYIFKTRGNARRLSDRVYNALTSRSQHSFTSESLPEHHVQHDPAFDNLEDEIAKSVSADFPKLLTEDEKLDFLKSWTDAFSNKNFEVKVCASCSHWEPSYDGRYKWMDHNLVPFHLLKNVELPRHLLPCTYDLTLYEDAILHPAGLQSPFTKGQVMLCPACHGDLVDRHQMPKYALANWLYYGLDRLPENVRTAFEQLSPGELRLIMRGSANSIVHRYNAKDPALGLQQYSKGNVMTVLTDSVHLRDRLPPTLDEARDTFTALFVGAEAPTNENIERLSPILISKSRVKLLIDFLVAHNPHYQVNEHFVGLDSQALESYPDVLDSDGAGPSSLPAQISICHLKPSSAVSSLESDYTDRNDLTSDSYSPTTLQDNEDTDDLLMENVSYTSGDFSQASFTEMKLQAVQHCLLGKKFLQSRRASSPLADFESQEILSWLFPHLDPWGVGGFYDTRRQRKLNMREQLVHLLSIVDSPFERDSSFAFIFHNILQKKANIECSHFRIKGRQQRLIIQALRDLRASPELLSTLAEKFRSNPHYKPSSPLERKTMDVLNKINMIPRDSPGSAGYKQCRRNEIRGLINKYGAPALFITLNPADVLHPLVRKLAGSSIDLEDHTKHAAISKALQRQLVADHPASATRFFNIMMRKFLDILLCNNLPGKSGIGIFGKCTAYYGMVEAQGKGTLHCHMLI
jgi:hypothetical protein